MVTQKDKHAVAGPERREAMKTWFNTQLARDGRTLTAVSEAAGISKSLASSWTNKGSGNPNELAQLCREMGTSVPEAFGVAGWLTEAEVEPQFPIPDVKPVEVDLVLEWRKRKGVSDWIRRIVLELLGLPRERADQG